MAARRRWYDLVDIPLAYLLMNKMIGATSTLSSQKMASMPTMFFTRFMLSQHILYRYVLLQILRFANCPSI